MDMCAKCNREILMSHPLDRCYHCNEEVCPECQEKGAWVVICETCVKRIVEQRQKVRRY
jgi:hypothetical protein